MTKLLLPIGIPNSGKTTWRKELEQNHGNQLGVISPDEIRMDLFKVEDEPRFEPAVWRLVELRLRECLETKPLCLLDATNVNTRTRSMPLRVARESNAEVEGHRFDISPRLAVLRNKLRERKVPVSVIYSYYHRLQEDPPTTDEGFSDIILHSQFPTKKECKTMGGHIDRETIRYWGKPPKKGKTPVCKFVEEIPLKQS